jgi:TM2 domain-containing membrane protein YozV
MTNDTLSKAVGYLLWIFGFTGAHRFYMGKWITAILYLLTGGLFLIGWLYDFCTLNSQVSELNGRPVH